jgi:hypothetical protein
MKRNKKTMGGRKGTKKQWRIKVQETIGRQEERKEQ